MKEEKLDTSGEITADDVRGVLISQVDHDTIPDQVLKAFQEHTGKKLTKHLLKHLPGGEEQWYITRQSGMTYLTNRAYHLPGNPGHRFYLAHSEKDVVIDPITLQEKNAGYFSYRRRSNEERREAIGNEVGHILMAAAINRVRRAREELELAQAELSFHTGDGEYSTDRYLWEKLAGKE